MTENDINGNAGKMKKNIAILVIHASSASLFENNSRRGEGGGADQLVQNAILGKNNNKAAFGNCSMQLKQETRTVRSRTLSKEETDFHLLMALLFHDLTRKKNDHLTSLSRTVVKRCMYPTFHHKFQVKKKYTESHDIRQNTSEESTQLLTHY